MNKLFWIAMTLTAGAFLPIQAGLNSKLGKAAASPVYASAISFLIGTIALVLYILFTRQTASWEGIKSAPSYVWAGGILGAFYVTVIILAFPRLGPGLTFGLIVAGQMVISILLDHFNILVNAPQPISIGRMIGIALIVIGVIIVKKF